MRSRICNTTLVSPFHRRFSNIIVWHRAAKSWRSFVGDAGPDAQSHRDLAELGRGRLAVVAAHGESVPCPAPAAERDLAVVAARGGPFEPVACEIRDAERAVGGRMRTDLVGTERLGDTAVGLGEISVVGREPVAVREQPAVGAARRALPFVLVARR